MYLRMACFLEFQENLLQKDKSENLNIQFQMVPEILSSKVYYIVVSTPSCRKK